MHPFPLTYGDAVSQILARISGRQSSIYEFWPDDPKQGGQLESEFRKWWLTANAKGEKQWLMDRVSRAENGFFLEDWACRLAKIAPSEALAAVRKGVHSSEDERTRAALISSLATIKANAVREFALGAMTHGPDPTSRLAAARIVSLTDPVAAQRAMSTEWVRLRPRDDESWITEDVAGFLAGSRTLGSLKALESKFESREFYIKEQVLCSLDAANKNAPRSVSYSTELEDFLASRLTDATRSQGSQAWISDRDFVDARICDLAACAPLTFGRRFTATTSPQRLLPEIGSAANP